MKARGDTPTLASGYVAELDRKGQRQVEPFVLVKKTELELFKATLDFLMTVMRKQGPRAETKEMLRALKTISVMLNLGEPIDLNTAPAKILELGLGSRQEIKTFEMTFDKVMMLSDRDFQSWLEEVEASIRRIRSFVDDPAIWIWTGEIRALRFCQGRRLAVKG